LVGANQCLVHRRDYAPASATDVPGHGEIVSNLRVGGAMRAEGRAAIVVLVAAVMLVIAAPSEAASPVVARLSFVPDSGPVIAGSGVAWTERSGSGSLGVVVQDSDGLRRRVAEVVRTDPWLLTFSDLAGTPEQVLFTVLRNEVTEDPAGGAVQVLPYAGDPRGVLAPLSGPVPAGGTDSGLRLIDAWRGELAFSGPRSQDRTIDGPAGPFLLPSGALMPRVAGKWAAWIEQTTIGGSQRPVVVMRNLVTGEQRLRHVLPPNWVSGLDIAEDGSAAVTTWRRDPSRVTLWVAKPGDHRLRALRTLSRGYRSARIQPGAIVTVSAPKGPPQGRISDGTLQVVDLDGGAPRTIATAVEDQADYSRYDADERSVVWMHRTCTGVEINRAAIGQHAPAQSPPRLCALRLRGALSRTRRGIEMTVSCAGFVRNCHLNNTTAQVRGPNGRWQTVAAAGPTDPDGAETPGGALAILHLTKHGRTLLRPCPDHLPLRVAAVQGDPTFIGTHPDLGAPRAPSQHRSTSATLAC
jgi:hypothetical protein